MYILHPKKVVECTAYENIYQNNWLVGWFHGMLALVGLFNAKVNFL